MPQSKTKQGITFNSPQIGDNANEYPVAYQEEQETQFNILDTLQNDKAGKNEENTYTQRQVFRNNPHITTGTTYNEANSILTSSEIDTKIGNSNVAIPEITYQLGGENRTEILNNIINEILNLQGFQRDQLFSYIWNYRDGATNSDRLLFSSIPYLINKVLFHDFNYWVSFFNRDQMIRASLKFIKLDPTRFNTRTSWNDAVDTQRIPNPFSLPNTTKVFSPMWVETSTNNSREFQNIDSQGWYVPDINSGNFVPSVEGVFLPNWIHRGPANGTGGDDAALIWENARYHSEDISVHATTDGTRREVRAGRTLASHQIPTPTAADLNRIRSRGFTYVPAGASTGVVTPLRIYKNNHDSHTHFYYGQNNVPYQSGDRFVVQDRKQGYAISHLANNHLFNLRNTSSNPRDNYWYQNDNGNTLDTGSSRLSRNPNGVLATQLENVDVTKHTEEFSRPNQIQHPFTCTSNKQELFLQSFQHDHGVFTRLTPNPDADVKNVSALEFINYVNHIKVFYALKVR